MPGYWCAKSNQSFYKRYFHELDEHYITGGHATSPYQWEYQHGHCVNYLMYGLAILW
jgi:hypothetical protein